MRSKNMPHKRLYAPTIDFIILVVCLYSFVLKMAYNGLQWLMGHFRSYASVCQTYHSRSPLSIVVAHYFENRTDVRIAQTFGYYRTDDTINHSSQAPHTIDDSSHRPADQTMTGSRAGGSSRKIQKISRPISPGWASPYVPHFSPGRKFA